MYEEARRTFRWQIPPRLNMAEDILRRNAPEALAVLDLSAEWAARPYSYHDLDDLSARLGNLLREKGVRPGDRVAVLLSQQVELPVAHLAAWRIGAVSVPLFALFGDDALAYRLKDSGSRAIVTSWQHWPKIERIREQWEPPVAVVADAPSPAPPGVIPWERIKEASGNLSSVDTGPDDPAVIIYTSGTTGAPKGALHGHRVLLGHMPGVKMSHGPFPHPEDRLWTPADWAWIGGLFDVLFPGLYAGVPVVAFRQPKFDPENALELLSRFAVRNVFMPPTALKILRSFTDRPHPGVGLRTLASGGEPLGEAMLSWVRDVFGVEAAEFYGQTEANLLVSNAPHWFVPRLGSMGRPVLGHDVKIAQADGSEVSVGEVGEVTLTLPDPVAFLGYWGQPEATRAKTRDGRVWTGDMARRDEQGYLYFVGRGDDLINTSGYRVGPVEIEDVILRHPAVSMVAVVGEPDPVRGQIVKAVIVLNAGWHGSPQLTQEIQDLVRTRLGAYEYPRIVEYVQSLPLTATGKIQRNRLRTSQ